MDKNQVELVVIRPKADIGHEEVIDRLIELDHEGAIELYNLTSLVKDESGELMMEEVSEVIEAETDLLKAMRVGGLSLYITILKSILAEALQAAQEKETVSVLDIDLSNENFKDLAQQVPRGGKLLMALMQGPSIEIVRERLPQLISRIHRFALSVEAPGESAELST